MGTAQDRHDGAGRRARRALLVLCACFAPLLAQDPGPGGGGNDPERRPGGGFRSWRHGGSPTDGSGFPGGFPGGFPSRSPGGSEASPGTGTTPRPPTPGEPTPSPKSKPYDPENLPRRNKELVTMTFENADVGSVLRALAEIWGKTVAIHPDLKGDITVIAAKDVSVADSLEIMRAALNVRGFTLVGNLEPATKVIEIWPRKDAVAQGSPVVEGADPNKLPPEARVVTQVIPLKFVPVADLVKTLTPLMPKENSGIVSIEGTNTLILTDTTGNLKRLLEIINLVDKVPEDRRTVEVVHLGNANASDVQKLLSDIFSDPIGAMSRTMSRGGQGGMPGGGGAQAQIMQLMQQGLLKPSEGIRITADTRTNSLVLYGPPETLAKLKEVISKLDQDVSRQVLYRRFKLQFADAAQVAQSLNQLFQQPDGGTSGRTPSFFRRFRSELPATDIDRGFTSLKENLVVPDLRTNSLLVTATADNLRVYEEMIRSLDQPSELQEVIEVIPLEFAKASTVEASLRRLLRGSQGDRGFFFFLFGQQQPADSPLEQLKDVTVVAEETSNSIIVSGPAATLPTLRRIVAGLDQPQAQVYISVIIADVTLTDAQQLGVELSWRKLPLKGDTMTTTFDLNAAITQGIKYALVHDEFQALLKALSDKQKVKVLSTPHITGLNNKPAVISIGSKFPFPKSQSESTGGNVVANFDLQDIVVKLQVTPRVSLGSQMVTLTVDQQIDELTGTVRQNQFELPLIATRRANTEVMVETGQTVVIGGIIREKKDKQKIGVPVLSSLPLLGPLFSREKERNERTELMVFLTPFVVTSDEQMQKIREQRQRDLDSEFPQLREYFRQQEGFGAQVPPKPGAPKGAGEPKPKPPVEPVPSISGPQPRAAAGDEPLGTPVVSRGRMDVPVPTAKRDVAAR